MQIHAITINTVNPQKLAAWWSEVIGIPVANDYGIIVQLASSPGFPPIQFQRIDKIPTIDNNVFLGLATSNFESETERLVQIGATIFKKFELPQIRYTTFTDPDGNKFDLVAR
ncbi:VOC family protein [Klebsiella michiganensis]